MFASPALQIEVEARKINVTIVFLDIDIFEDAAQIFVINGSKDGIVLQQNLIALGLCQAGALIGAPRCVFRDGLGT